MKWREVFGVVASVVVIVSLFMYWFFSAGPVNFSFSKNDNSNFSLTNSSAMQFYLNMRFPEANISYFIDDCPLQRKNDMEQAFEDLSEQTILNFYEKQGEEISITCDSETKMEEGLFIAGEGGPTKIIGTDLFSVIYAGKILLVRDSKCANPNVAMHELMHVLGFGHSENPDNLMYYLSKCSQTIGEDQIKLINDLYSMPSYPDLYFTNISAVVQSGVLDAKVSVKNQGLKNSTGGVLFVYADGKLVEDFNLTPIEVGAGTKISLRTKLGLLERSAEQLKFIIDTDFEEIDKTNNEIILDVG